MLLLLLTQKDSFPQADAPSVCSPCSWAFLTWLKYTYEARQRYQAQENIQNWLAWDKFLNPGCITVNFTCSWPGFHLTKFTQPSTSPAAIQLMPVSNSTCIIQQCISQSTIIYGAKYLVLRAGLSPFTQTDSLTSLPHYAPVQAGDGDYIRRGMYIPQGAMESCSRRLSWAPQLQAKRAKQRWVRWSCTIHSVPGCTVPFRLSFRSKQTLTKWITALTI